MSDVSDTGGGANIEGDANTGGGNLTGRDDTRNRQQANSSLRGGDTYYGGDNSQQWIIAQIGDHAQQIRYLSDRLDDLPNKFIRLENRVDTQGEKLISQGDRVKRLEDVEVIVRKDEVVIRPILPPETPGLNLKRLTIWLAVGFLIIVVLVGYLIFLQAVRGG